MELHFILNPYAGNGRGEKIWGTFEQQLQIPFEVHMTTYAGHARDVAQIIARNANEIHEICLIAIGGDGTIHEVLNGVGEHANVYVGAISAGSGNDFARGFATFEHAEQIERFVRTRAATKHDFGVAEFDQHSKLFVNNFGVGFDALVAITANESKLKKALNRFRLGKLSYPYFVIHALFTYKPFQLAVNYSGQQQVYNDVWFATISNQPFFGGGMNLSPTSNTADGTFEVTIVSNLSKWKLLVMFGSVFFAKHTKLKEVHQFAEQAITFEFDAPVLAHADGEKQQLEVGKKEIKFSIKRNGWQLAK